MQGCCKENCSSHPQCAPWSSAYAHLNDNCVQTVAAHHHSVIRTLPACHYQGTGDQLGAHLSAWPMRKCTRLVIRLGPELNFNSFLCDFRQVNHLLWDIGPNAILSGLLSGARDWLWWMEVPIWLRAWHDIRTHSLMSYSLFYENPRRIFLVLITDPRSVFVSSLGATGINLSFHFYRINSSSI